MEKFLVFGLLLVAILSTGCVYSLDPRVMASTRSAPLPSSGTPGASTAPSNPSNPGSNSLVLSMSEVAKHTTASDCWMAINSIVYNLSSYTSHPGGDTYVPYCGTDATVAFDTKGGRGNSHSGYANSLLQSFELGPLNQSISVPTTPPPNPVGSPNPPRGSNGNGFEYGDD